MSRTFGTAGWRIAKEVWQAHARSNVAVRSWAASALGIGTTGRWLAGIRRSHDGLDDLLAALPGVGVTCESWPALAGGFVGDDKAVGIVAAPVRVPAWVDALELATGQVGPAVRIDFTLRMAVGRRAQVARQAGAGAVSAALSLLAVWSARVGVARVLDLVVGDDSAGRRVALVGRIAFVAFEAGADWLLVDHVAHGVDATQASTRILFSRS